jgi:hypothetical protein
MNRKLRPLNSMSVGRERRDEDRNERRRQRDRQAVEERGAEVALLDRRAVVARVEMEQLRRVREQRPPAGGIRRVGRAERRDEHADRRDDPQQTDEQHGQLHAK